MPLKSMRFCKHPGCGNLTRDGYCEEHMAEHERMEKERSHRYNRERGSAASNGYGFRWQIARLEFLKHNPLCAECEKNNETTPATIVDHIKPHKGNTVLFWDISNWQPLCKKHHDIKTAKEDGGFGNRERGKF